MIHILLAYFHLRFRNRFSKWFPISFEMWVAGVQEMHEGRETKLLPIQLGRRPSSSKPGAFKHAIPNSRKLQSLGAGGCYPNYLLVSSNCHPLVSQLSLRCSHLSPTVARLPCRCGLAIVSCLPIVPWCFPLVFRLFLTTPTCLSDVVLTSFPIASQMWSSSYLSLVSLSLEFGTVTAVGLRSWVNELSIKDAEWTRAERTPWLKKDVWYS